ncbi:MAG: 4Fe-4S dicluster domain-containing protein [Nitrospirota bacterium]|nr:4Fe-4S dicluster domain-containing protein [Nitrospirota bacterium]
MENRTGISRRQFLGGLAVSSLAVGLPSLSEAAITITRYAKLHDTTKCIGCKRCMSACKRWNKLKIDRAEDLTDRETELTGNTWVVVNLKTDLKNRGDRTYIHWACQHCEKPACASACPVSAITKYPEGPVVINEKKCVGCKYCIMSCPYNVPQFDGKKRVTRKCTMCYDRIKSFIEPACVTACPVRGALDFGPKNEILKKAKDRTEEINGYLLGEHEAGGTDVLTILKRKPEDLGLIVASKEVVNKDIDKIKVSFSGFSGAAAAVGLLYLYSRLGKGE